MLNNLSNLSTKKKLTYITITVLLVITIAVATAFILKSASNNNTNNNQTQTKTPATKASADALKAKAIEALKTNNTNTAKTLFQDAKQQYQDLGDTNNIKDVEAQLYMIEHQLK